MIDPIQINLTQHVFKTLNTREKPDIDKWIDSDVIDAFAYAHIDEWENVSYIPASSTYFMIGDHVSAGLNICEKTNNSIYETEKPFGNVASFLT